MLKRRKRRSEGLIFSSLPALFLFLDVLLKFEAKSFLLLSTSASCEGKSQVKAFHIRASVHKNEMYNVLFRISLTSKRISQCAA